MALLDPPFSPMAFEIRQLIRQKRRREVMPKIAELLRRKAQGKGQVSIDAEFLTLVADVLDPEKNVKLYPKEKELPWLEIGKRFEELDEAQFKNSHNNRKKKIDQLMKDFDYGRSSIEKALAIYESADTEDRATRSV